VAGHVDAAKLEAHALQALLAIPLGVKFVKIGIRVGRCSRLRISLEYRV